MAQIIQLKRGGIGALSASLTAATGEILIVTGSSGDLQGPFLVVGKGETSASLVNPVQLGGTPPTLDADNKQLNGVLFYDTGSNKLYRLNEGTNTEITFAALNNEGRFALTGSTNFFKDSQFITGSTLLAASGDGTGTAVQESNNYALVVSQSVHAYNHNVGYPTSNAWKSSLNGSYFNTFDANSDTSEVLRFIAGLLSSSAPSPTPNTKTFGGITGEVQNLGDAAVAGTDYPSGKIPEDITDAEVLYTIDKGFSSKGEELFGNVSDTKYNNADVYYRYESDTAGSTTVRSSADDELFGAGELSNGAATNVRVTGSITFTYEDNNSDTSTSTSSSQHVTTYVQSTFGTQNNITVGKINTTNPSVIPAQFQDTKFISFADGETKIFNSSNNNIDGRSKTDISSSGYYKWNASIAVQTGSQLDSDNFSTLRTALHEIFWLPPAGNIFSTLDTALSSNDVSFSEYLVTSESFTSRSLSGAPYLNAAQFDYFVTASNVFNPLYTTEANIATLSITDTFAEDSTNGTDVSATDGSVFNTITQNTSNGQITQAGFVFNGATDQNGSIPNISSEIHLKTRTTLGSINGSKTNMTKTTSNAISDTIKSEFTVNKIDTDGTAGTSVTDNNFQHRPHLAGAFGQPSSSGSMAIFLSNDGQDTSTNNETTTVREKFLGEEYRRTISDCQSAANLEVAFTSGSYLSTSAPRPAQVKPGYLVIPGTTYGYWYPSSHYDASNYYWYLREVEFNVSTQQNTLTINFGPNVTLTDWATGGANTISAGIIFESSIQGQGSPALSRTRLFDLTKPTSNTTNEATGDNNPFSSNIDIYGYPNGTAISSGTATITITAGAYQELGTNNFTKIWLLTRQRGENANNILEDVQFTVS